MTIFREYGPFKGVHNSTSNLAQKQGYILDSENMLVNQDNGDMQKRPGAIEKDVLTECIGITKHIVERSNGDENLYIVGTKNKLKDTIASMPISAGDYLGAGLFPAKAVGDSFSSFLYNGNLYYNYGGKVFKWDNKYSQVVSKRKLLGTSGSPLTDHRLLIQVYGCDVNQDVAFIYEKEFITHLGDVLYPFVFGFGLDVDNANASLTGLNNHFAEINSGPIDTFSNAVELTFGIRPTGFNNLVVGDPIYLRVYTGDENFLAYETRADYRKFIVTFSDATTVKVGNPLLFKACAITAPGLGYCFLTSYVAQVFRWDSTLGIFMEAVSLLVGSATTVMEFAYPMVASYAYNFRITAALTSNTTSLPYESPVYPRKNLPQCKHISQSNGLMFLSCPKVSNGDANDDTDFDYQTLAWSSENPEDSIETWGGLSAIIGTEDEGRIYACVPNNGNIVIFKERVLYFSETPIDGIIQPIKVTGSSIGCKDPQSIQECNGLLVFYVRGKGIYAYRSGMAQAQELSMGFRGTFKTLSGQVNSSHDILNSKYILSIGTTTFVYDYLIDSWWIWKGFNADCGLEYFQEKIVGVNALFHLFDLEQGILHDTVKANTFPYTSSNVAISAYIVPNWFSGFDTEMDKKLKALRVWSLNGSSAMTVDAYKNFRYVSDYNFTIKNDIDTIDIADFARSESGKRKFKAITFKISNAIIDQDMKITGWALDYEPTGVESKNFEGAR
jgi:hypothetical protein